MTYTYTINRPIVTFQKQGQEKKQMKLEMFLKKTALFTDMPLHHLQIIAKSMVKRTYNQGEIIFREGDPGQVLYFILAGQVRIYVNGLYGNETSVILFGRPGDIFGELAVIDGLPRSATAAALHHTVLYTIRREQFRDLMRRYPQLSLNFMKELSQRVRYNTRQMDSLASLPVPQRLARKLMELAKDFGNAQQDGVLIDMMLTQGNLASLIGATRESTNKSLRDFRQKEWIHLNQGYITILDPDALRAQVSG